MGSQIHINNINNKTAFLATQMELRLMAAFQALGSNFQQNEI
jgi:hypothetical protein